MYLTVRKAKNVTPQRYLLLRQPRKLYVVGGLFPKELQDTELIIFNYHCGHLIFFQANYLNEHLKMVKQKFSPFQM